MDFNHARLLTRIQLRDIVGGVLLKEEFNFFDLFQSLHLLLSVLVNLSLKIRDDSEVLLDPCLIILLFNYFSIPFKASLSDNVRHFELDILVFTVRSLSCRNEFKCFFVIKISNSIIAIGT